MDCLGRGVRQRHTWYAVRRILPESHLGDETKGVVTLSMGVVGTLTALVLSLLIATASTTFNTRNQEITVIAAKVIQLDRLLRRYGPEWSAWAAVHWSFQRYGSVIIIPFIKTM